MTKEVDCCVRELLLVSYAFLVKHKKNRQCLFIVGFTICSLTPVVTTLGNQFLASMSNTIAYSYKMSICLFTIGSGEGFPSHSILRPQHRRGSLLSLGD